MTTRETIEAELKQMVFDLLHERDDEELEEGHKDALAHSRPPSRPVSWTTPRQPPGGMRLRRPPRSAESA